MVGFVGIIVAVLGLVWTNLRWLAVIGLLVALASVAILERARKSPTPTQEEIDRLEWTTKQGVICFLFHEGKTLLSRGWPAWQWQPPVGALLPGERLEDCVIRVVLEEGRATIQDSVRIGVIRAYDTLQGPEPYRTIHVFYSENLVIPILEDRTSVYDEKEPKYLKWFPTTALPDSLRIFDKDEELLSLILSKRRFVADFHYKIKDEEYEERELKEYRIRPDNNASIQAL